MRKALFFLGCMSEPDVEWIVRNGARRQLAKGAILIEEGRPTDSLFFLLSGRLAVSTRAAGVVASLETGEVVGEISFVDSRPPTASVAALVDCEIGVVPRRQLTAKLSQDLAFAAHFYQAIAIFLADRLRTATANVGGKGVKLSEDVEDEDELAGHLLDTLSMAGSRFSDMQRRPWGESTSS
ncbi:MAG: cyclic nucleotide-binding domain-containing protein [Terriglobia bacterium]